MKFYSNGKLLLTSEYLVLDGAKSLALPTKFGQFLEVIPLQTISKTTKNNRLLWQSLDEKGNIWFTCEYKLPNFIIKCEELLDSETLKKAKKLQEILREAKRLNPFFLSKNESFHVKTILTFNKNWGLGTSSTLINNIAQWAKVDAFALQFKTFGGSAYDIACAQNNTPIVYQLNQNTPFVKPVNFNPPFKKNLFFVYLNTKKNSRTAIKSYQNIAKNKQKAIKLVTNFTENLLKTDLNLTEFEAIINQHEQILSIILGIKPIKKNLFPDYFGAIKSLGAWEGDFILATGNKYTPAYFKRKGFSTIIRYSDIIK